MTKEITAKNYFEHIATIQTANFFYAEKESEYLYLLVLTSKKADFTNTENIPLRRYSDTLEEWQVYPNESLQNLLKEFSNRAKVNVQVYYLDNASTEKNNRQVLGNIRKYKDKIIFVVDAFSLSMAQNQDLATQELDQNNKNALGGLLIPICEHYSKEESTFAKDLAKETLFFVHQEWENELKYSFGHTELEVPNKTHFFRRLINIAFYKKLLSEAGAIPEIEIHNKNIIQPKDY